MQGKPRLTGLLTEFHAPQRIACTTVDALGDSKSWAEIKLNAMNTVHAKLNLSSGHDAYFQMLSA
jgi:hypothetical protein